MGTGEYVNLFLEAAVRAMMITRPNHELAAMIQ
jgi:hypothetical protein